MTKPQKKTVETTGTQTQQGTTTGKSAVTGMSQGAQLNLQNAQKMAQQRQSQIGGGTGVTKGSQARTGTTTTTGTTNQRGTNLQNTAGNTGYQFNWVKDRPMTAELQALKDYKGTVDPRIQFAAAAERERLERYGQNPYGAGTPAALRDASLRSGSQAIDQRMAQEMQIDKFNRDNAELGKLTNIAQMMAPIREMAGQTSTGTMTGETGMTGTQQQVAQTAEQIDSMSEEEKQNWAQSQGMSFEDARTQALNAQAGETAGTSMEEGTTNMTGTSTGKEVTTTPNQLVGQILGGAAGIGAAKMGAG